MSGDHENFTNKINDNEDNRLKNWSKWQEKWKKVQEGIAEKLKLEKENLLMNYAEDIQQYKQEKEILDCAKITTEFDKYRGNPDFYKLPLTLPKLYKSTHCKKCCCCKIIKCCNSTEPTYYLIKTKKESNIVPPIDMVAIPKDLLIHENNLYNETRTIYKKWQNNKYRQEQLTKFSNKIQQIIPHFPNFEHLVVIGKKMSVTTELEEVSVNQEPHYVTEASSEIIASQNEKLIIEISEKKDEATTIKSSKKPRLSFKINDTVMDSQTTVNGTGKIVLFFDYDLSLPQLHVQYVEFENNGLATIRISWKKIEKYRLFRDFVKKKWDEHGFYFNRQELVILPGGFVKLPIWFKTNNVGCLSEQWEISTIPKIWNDNFHLILILESYSWYSNLKQQMDIIVNLIQLQSKNLLIKDILDEILETLKYTEKPVTDCVYGEPQLFELANLYNGRPVILYNEEFFTELTNLYDKIKQSETKWDLSLSNLRKLAQKKDIWIYSQKKITEIQEKIQNIENNKAKEMLTKEKGKKPKKGKQKKEKKSKKKNDKASKKSKKTKSHKSKSKSQTEIQNEIVPETIIEPYEYSNQIEFCNILKQFDSPVIINTEKDKYFACYHILTSYFTKMCHQLQDLETENNVIRKSSYPAIKNNLLTINEHPERLVYEYFEHHYIPTIVKDEDYSCENKRKPKILKDIPEGDMESLYTTYFNKPLPSKKDAKEKKSKGKKKKGKQKKKGKSKDKSKKSKGKKIPKKIVPKEESILSFNPYCENFVYVPEIEEFETTYGEDKINIPKKNLEDHKYKQYLTVYSCLSEAIDAVFDTLESFECVASYTTLTELIDQLPNSEEK